jgi:hypothetical protein
VGDVSTRCAVRNYVAQGIPLNAPCGSTQDEGGDGGGYTAAELGLGPHLVNTFAVNGERRLARWEPPPGVPDDYQPYEAASSEHFTAFTDAAHVDNLEYTKFVGGASTIMRTHVPVPSPPAGAPSPKGYTHIGRGWLCIAPCIVGTLVVHHFTCGAVDACLVGVRSQKLLAAWRAALIEIQGDGCGAIPQACCASWRRSARS